MMMMMMMMMKDAGRNEKGEGWYGRVRKGSQVTVRLMPRSTPVDLR